MSRTIEHYVLACAKAQGKLSKLLLNTGEWDSTRRTYLQLIEELQLLKEVLLKDDTLLADKIDNIKKGGKINTGSCYTDPMLGWGGIPFGGWPTERAGMVYSYKNESNQKPGAFGRSVRIQVGNRGKNDGFFRERI